MFFLLYFKGNLSKTLNMIKAASKREKHINNFEYFRAIYLLFLSDSIIFADKSVKKKKYNPMKYKTIFKARRGLAFLAMMTMFVMGMESASVKSLHQLQQEFIDRRFGMFIHFNMPTFYDQDWPDPDAPVTVFNPTRLDCRGWAKAAREAGMSYGCLTSKHHSGFCIWDTKTTDYNVMNSPLHRDVVKEYADAFRAEGLEVYLYYSILDTHHRLRPHMITPAHTQMIKDQLTELLTHYGKIAAIIIDGWDAPWSRISYDEVPFEDIYLHIKALQPECLVMDLNAAKYPREALFYTDIKSYEQGAGQHISTQQNRLPALACLPLQSSWFWKSSFPTDKLKDPEELVKQMIEPYGDAYCTFILNVAPNREGRIDDNALAALRKIGLLWTRRGHVANLPEAPSPIISSNLAKNRPSEGTWSDDYAIYDFANDDDFGSCWNSNREVITPWWSVTLECEKPFNMVVITDRTDNRLQRYRIEYLESKGWKTLFEGPSPCRERVKIHRFPTVWGSQIRLTVLESRERTSIAEVGVYFERNVLEQ